ncbi:MAG: Zn-ribbon domain-containing OB-fold protein [Gammaproteobacteria bacterium]
MSPSEAPARPLPEIEPETAPFWEAAREHRLVMQRCTDCGTYRYPPELGCYQCGSTKSQWQEVSGNATLQTWTVLHPPVLPWFKDRTPFPVAVVELAEGPRMATNLVDIPVEEYRVGMPLRVEFEDVRGEEVTLVKFRRP